MAVTAVVTASVTMLAAHVVDPAFPARSRIPATTGAAVGVEIVVASGAPAENCIRAGQALAGGVG